MNFPAQFQLSDLNGRNGFVLRGVDEFSRFGYSVSDAGDVNGDGIDDLIIGARDASPSDRFLGGESYVVFGNDAGFDAVLTLSDLDGSNGFALSNLDATDASRYAGRSVSGAGDINGDGFDDLIIAQVQPNPIDGKQGESYVVFGSDASFDETLDLSTLNGRNGFVINGADAYDFFSRVVSSAGDINGDGFDDVLLGAPFAAPNGSASGESYVVFGSDADFGATLNLSDLDGNNGFVLNGIDAGDASGFSLSGAGDINGDGIDDLIIGANRAEPNGLMSGESYVVFGRDTGFDAALALSDLDGNNGFVLNGIDRRDESGRSVSSAGDINGDGIDDLIIGAPKANPKGSESGESYVVFGRDAGFDAALNLSDLDGSNGFVLNGIDADDEAGVSVSGAGDINNDGIDDLIIGAPKADPTDGVKSGESYVVFGRDTGFDAALNLSDLDGSNGFVLSTAGQAYSGVSVSGAGDVNGDGIDDLIIGAPSASPLGDSYVVFGRSATVEDGVTINGTNRADILVGTSGDDIIRGRANKDRLTGKSGDDILNGDDGRDILNGEAGNDILEGGNGSDQIMGGEGRDTLNGGNGSDTLNGGKGRDVIEGGRGNDLLEGDRGDDILGGGSGNDLLTGGLGRDQLTGGEGRDTFTLAIGQGVDTITDFSLRKDKLALSGRLTFGRLRFVGDDIFLDNTNKVIATLTGIATESLTAANFTEI